MFQVLFLADADRDSVQKNNVIFESSSWFSHDVLVSCFKDKEKVCIAYGLCLLSAFVSVVACLLLTYQRCYLRKQITADAATCAVYCVLGHLCHSVGAFLSKQLSFQVIMGAFWAVLDLITFFAVLLPMYLFSHSEKGRRMRMMKMRRRQNLLSVCLLLTVVGGGMHLTARSHAHPVDTYGPYRRRLLGAIVYDSLELLGYILGLLSFVISWTSRFPVIVIVYNRKQRGTVHSMAGILYAVAGGLYTAAILIHDTRLSFVVKALPWIMSSTCWGVLEFLILALSLSRRRSVRHQTVRSLSSDTVALLASGSHTGKGARKRKLQDKEDAPPFYPTTNCTLPKRTEMGHYMDVNIQPVRKVCLKEVRVSREGQCGSEPLKRTVKVVRVDDACSSGSSSDSSSFYSDDLEVSSHFLTRQLQATWDFEEAASTQWCKVSKEQDCMEAFPLQPWTVKPTLTANTQPGTPFCSYDKGLTIKMAADELTDCEKTESCSGK
ncbi:transmembrane protein 44 isoform X1 [Alosa pseudoharengus]|uniref:transmembrane protein 44 isoform X1 n=1 Tax=Alosa pseudoharengus TaxID=34774 RepID=UPI003F8CB165